MKPSGASSASLAQQVQEVTQEVTGETVAVLYADAAYIGEETAAAAQAHGMRLVVVQRPEGSHGFVLLPKRLLVERSFAWVSRFRRLARDYERLPATLIGLHFAAFICLLYQVASYRCASMSALRCPCGGGAIATDQQRAVIAFLQLLPLGKARPQG